MKTYLKHFQNRNMKTYLKHFQSRVPATPDAALAAHAPQGHIKKTL